MFLPNFVQIEQENDYSIVYRIIMLTNPRINLMQRRVRGRGLPPVQTPAIALSSASFTLIFFSVCGIPTSMDSWRTVSIADLRYSARVIPSTRSMSIIRAFFSGILLVELHHIGPIKQVRRIPKAANTRNLFKYKYFLIYD